MALQHKHSASSSHPERQSSSTPTASMRAMKAKLLILKRPMVWASASVVVMAGYLGIQYLTHPEWLQPASQTAGETDRLASPLDNATDETTNPLRPPAQDNGIGADIDNLPLLFGELQATDSEGDDEDENRRDSDEEGDRPLGLLAPLSANPDEGDRASGLGDRSFYDGLFSRPASPDSLGSTLAPTIPSLLQPNAASLSPMGLDATGSGALSGTPLNPQRSSPLQGAIEQLSISGASSQPAERIRPGELESSPFFPGLTRFPGIANPSRGTSLQTSPLPGTTGYTVPPVLRAPTNPYMQTAPVGSTPSLPNSFAAPQGYSSPFLNPSFSGTPSGIVPGTSMPPTPQIPGSVPGAYTPNSSANPQTQPTPNRRYNGGGRGGRINTFSNP